MSIQSAIVRLSIPLIILSLQAALTLMKEMLAEELPSVCLGSWNPTANLNRENIVLFNSYKPPWLSGGTC